jgi:hypothetical protein
MIEHKTYEMIGSDGEKYGPFSIQELEETLSQGRADKHTQIRETGSEEWLPLGKIITSDNSESVDQQFGPTIPSDQPLDMNKALVDGWVLLKEHLGILVGAGAIFFGIVFAAAMIPFGQLFVQGPMMGGLIILILKLSRHGQAEVGDVFLGFQNYLQLLLATIVQGAIVFASMIPGVIIMIICGLVFFESGNSAIDPNPLGIALLITGGLLSLTLSVISLILTFFLVHLVADKRGEFGEALSATYKGGKMNFWSLFGMLIIIGIVSSLIIILTCGIGLLFVLPWTTAVGVKAYEQIFPTRTTILENP